MPGRNPMRSARLASKAVTFRDEPLRRSPRRGELFGNRKQGAAALAVTDLRECRQKLQSAGRRKLRIDNRFHRSRTVLAYQRRDCRFEAGRDLDEHRGRYAVGPFFVFLDLLEGYADCVG